MENKIAVLGAVLDNPKECQEEFNKVISQYRDIVRGRMGIPFEMEGVSVVSVVVIGTIDEINSLTGKLGNIKGVNIKTSISKKQIQA